MLTGIRFQAKPSATQKLKLNQWMGCARFIWNAKTEENRYFKKFADKFTTKNKLWEAYDQSYSHFKDKELSPWLFQCPGGILSATIANWYTTLIRANRGICGYPQKKKKKDGESILLTANLFRLEKNKFGQWELWVGNSTHNLGKLKVNFHTNDFQIPKTIRIRQKSGQYYVSFCYEDGIAPSKLTPQEQLECYQHLTQEELESISVGVDRGVANPIQVMEETYDFSPQQKKNLEKLEKQIKRYQRKFARQQANSKRRFKTKTKLAKKNKKKADIRQDMAHQSSRKIVDKENTQIFFLEKLNVSGMTRKSKTKTDPNNPNNFLANGAKAKSGLNKAILNVGWYQIECFITYKSLKAGKTVFQVPAHYTSQECATCGHTHPENRKTQAEFKCISCGHTDHADKNAAKVIQKRGIKLILDTGTVLVDDKYLSSTTGRGGTRKTKKRSSIFRKAVETSKMKEPQVFT